LLLLPVRHGASTKDRLGALCLIFSLLATLHIFYVNATGGSLGAFLNAFLSINLGLFCLMATSRGYWVGLSADRVIKVFLSATFILILYGFCEVLQIVGVPRFHDFVRFVRGLLVVRSEVYDRLAWLANEPSFASFQICTAFLLNELYFSKRRKSVTYRFIQVSLLLQILFCQSLLGYLSFVIILVFLISRQITLFLLGTEPSLVCAILELGFLRGRLGSVLSRVVALARGTDASFQTRIYLTLSTYLSCLHTYFLGFGLGQYRFHWKEVFAVYDLPHTATGELVSLWQATDLVKPYSVLGGILAEMGIIGGVVFLLILWQVFGKIRRVKSHRQRRIMTAAFFYAVFILTANAYAPVTPTIWFLLGIIYLKANEESLETSSALTNPP